VDTDFSSASAAKFPAIADQSCQSPVFKTPAPTRRGLAVAVDSPTTAAFHPGRNNISTENFEDSQSMPGVVTGTPHLCANDQLSGNLERMTLDSMVVQYLKHQHRQCPAPITTLPPVSLLHAHVCPEPSHSISAPPNVTARMGSREISREFSGIQVPRRDRQFIYSRFKPCRVCRDESSLLTCMTFIQTSTRVAAGNHTGELRIFDSNTANLLETQSCHQNVVTTLESTSPGGGHELILSSSLNDVKLWDAFSVSTGPLHTFKDCKAARFNHAGTLFAAISTDASRRVVLLYDVQTRTIDMQLPDNSSLSGSGRNYVHPIVHFSPSYDMLLWNGVLWDRRSPNPVHQFDQFTDYCGGGFHPAGNEVFFFFECSYCILLFHFIFYPFFLGMQLLYSLVSVYFLSIASWEYRACNFLRTCKGHAFLPPSGPLLFVHYHNHTFFLSAKMSVAGNNRNSFYGNFKSFCTQEFWMTICASRILPHNKL
jgi:HIV-1 Vpr-binding protein